MITQADRELVGQQWRVSEQARNMPAGQAEQYAQQILSGGADMQVQQYMQQLQQQQPLQQPQQSAADSQNTGFLEIPSIFGGSIKIPLGPQPTMQPIQPYTPFQPLSPSLMQPPPPFQPFPALSPPPLPGFPTLAPVQAPTPQPLPSVQPMATNQLVSQGQQMQNSVGIPQQSTRTIHFPGGSADQHNVSFSGQVGGGHVSYQASSTSGSWSSTGLQPQTQPAYPQLTNFAPPAPIQTPMSPPPQPQMQQGFVGTMPPTPAAVPAKKKKSKGRHREPSIANPVLQPNVGTSVEPQNSRLHGAFTQQLNEETYFSSPPGAPDVGTGQGGAQ